IAAADRLTTPHLFAAAAQDAGRGRLGRTFFSKGGVYMTLILSSRDFALSPSLLTTAAGCAAVKAIETQYPAGAKIKWVNDILVDDRKVCGILAEAKTDPSAGRITHYVIGWGYNVGKTDFTPELSEIAGSLDGEKTDKNRLCADTAAFFLDELRKSPREILSFAARSSAVLGRQIRYFSSAEEGEGTAVSLGQEGELIVKLADGREKVLAGGEISVRFPK
ncbi:MAG: biotin--[acetyl-CoA-carboxylase] ligase, partial [Ruminococcus sp.]|nr:biotin--[acetyl-CoA-carboxylase] ligase [Candidatus Apopatosoma intestinale]